MDVSQYALLIAIVVNSFAVYFNRSSGFRFYVGLFGLTMLTLTLLFTK